MFCDWPLYSASSVLGANLSRGHCEWASGFFPAILAVPWREALVSWLYKAGPQYYRFFSDTPSGHTQLPAQLFLRARRLQ